MYAIIEDPATFDTTLEKLSDFERLILCVDQKVMTGDMFRRLASHHMCMYCMYVCMYVCIYVRMYICMYH